MRLIVAMCCAAAITAFVVPNARADEYNKKTFVTFSGPVQVPGATLPAGTYTIKLADPESGRRVIQIWNKETTHLYATLLTIPYQRRDAADTTIVMFREMPAGESPAVRAWFYTGERDGQEFVYPRNQAAQIAKAVHMPVLSMADNSPSSDGSALRSSSVGRIDDTGQFTADSSTTSNSVASTASGASAPAPTATASVRRELPVTASSLPLFELLCGLSFAGALGLRAASKRFANN